METHGVRDNCFVRLERNLQTECLSWLNRERVSNTVHQQPSETLLQQQLQQQRLVSRRASVSSSIENQIVEAGYDFFKRIPRSNEVALVQAESDASTSGAAQIADGPQLATDESVDPVNSIDEQTKTMHEQENYKINDVIISHPHKNYGSDNLGDSGDLLEESVTVPKAVSIVPSVGHDHPYSQTGKPDAVVEQDASDELSIVGLSIEVGDDQANAAEPSGALNIDNGTKKKTKVILVNDFDPFQRLLNPVFNRRPRSVSMDASIRYRRPSFLAIPRLNTIEEDQFDEFGNDIESLFK